MRPELYDKNATRVPVSLELNADLHAKALAAGIDASAVVEQALIAALRERVREEIRQELEAVDRYTAEYGSFAELMRDDEAALANRQAV